MNKVFSINLGGYAFTIDEDAYHHLKQYLSAIDSHFRNSEGFDDITTDIEIRMAEIFSEKMQGRQIVSIKDVTEAINIMGTPEDFGAESNYTGVPHEEAEQSFSKEKKKSTTQKFGKRMYRNPDETVVGGVASGVSAYFGIEDPVWIRIVFALLVLGGGSGILLYVILWAVLPEAKTAKQKLEMRGEKIDVNSIAKTIEEEVNHLKDKFQEIGDEFKEGGKYNKKKNKEEKNEMHYGTSSMDGGIAFVRQSAGAFEQFVRATFKPLLIIIGIILMIVVAALWISSIVFAVTARSYTPFLVGVGNAPIVNTLAFLAIGIPIFSMALGIIRTFFRTKVNKYLRIGLAVAFVGVISSFFYFASDTAGEFNVRQSFEENTILTSATENVLELAAKDVDYRSGLVQFGGVKVIDDAMVYKGAELTIVPGDGDQFELLKKYSGRGETTTKATQNAEKVIYEMSWKDGKLVLPSYVTLKNGLFRDQEVDLFLKVPKGKSVQLNQDICWAMPLSVKTEKGYYYSHQLVNKKITATEKGLICEDCEEKPVEEGAHFDFSNFSRLHVTGNVKVHLSKGDYNISVDEFNQHNSLMINHHEDLLTINRTEGGRELEVYISVPDLKELRIQDVEDTWINDFDFDELKLEVVGDADVHADNLNAQVLNISASGRAEIRLKGSSQSLTATLKDNAELDAEGFQVNIANVEGYDNTDIKVNVTDTLYQKISKDADLDFSGTPVTVTSNE